MMHYKTYRQWKKGVQAHAEEDEESQSTLGLVCENYNKRTRPKLLPVLFLSLLSCSLMLAPQLGFSPHFSVLYSSFHGDEGLVAEMGASAPPCSSIPNGTICCDRSSIRSDICIMKGDVRTYSASSSIYLYASRNTDGLIDYVPGFSDDGEEDQDDELQHEKIRPYTRKWETHTTNTIDELHLVSKRENSRTQHKCDVFHDVPAVFFSTGGYTGNVYHEFNDGIIPLYITSQHLKKKVVFVILEYHDWWYSKYGDVLSLLSDYPPVDFRGDNRTHCFPEAIVGLRIHDELAIDPSLMEGNQTIKDFRHLLDRAYRPRIKGLIQDEEKLALQPSSDDPSQIRKEGKDLKKPKLVIVSRNGSRVIRNEDSLVKMAEEIGFWVEVLRPQQTSELAKIYQALNSSDVMIGVHGAAMTHCLFVRPGSVFIQIVPLGTEWAAETYYGEPAVRLGLRYIGYKILPRESSLYNEYDKKDPVLKDPDSIGKKGWEFTKKIYLDHQDVRLNLTRFRKRLIRAYNHTLAKNKTLHLRHLSE